MSRICDDCGAHLHTVDADWNSERGFWPLYEDHECNWEEVADA